MTTPTGEAAAPPDGAAVQPRPRPARRALDVLSLRVERADVDTVQRTGHWPDWLAVDRHAAFDAFEALPGEANRLYTPYIDLRPAQLENAVLATSGAAGPASTRLPDGADGIVELEDGAIVASALSEEARAGGVEFASVSDLHARRPERVRELLERPSALPADDKFAQLTRALWSQGIVLDVPAGVRLARPLIVRWRVDEPDRAVLSRTIVSLGDGARASLVEEFVPSVPGRIDGGQSLLGGTTEVVLGRGAELAVASLQELGPGSVVFQHRTATIGDDASLHWALAQLGGRLVRSRVDNTLVGDRSSVEQVEIVFGGGEQLFDLTSYTTHVGRDTTGNLLSKGALLDRSRSYMKGLITIEKSAIGTDSFLGEFGMNLSKAARAVAIPSLEIDQPDCRRAAHSSSVGPIDETQLFYLETRGIPADEARKIIVLGFLEPVVARVPLGDVQDRLRELLEAKWAAGTVDAAAA